MRLNDIAARQKEFLAKQPSGPSDQLWLKSGDIAFVHFLSTGDDGYIEVYVAHEVPATTQGGYPQRHYCPVESDHDASYTCPFCPNDYKKKQRMAMWFYVSDILHKTLKPEDQQRDQLPVIEYNGQSYYHRAVNAYKLWDDSAWRESPLDDIVFYGAQYGNLRTTGFTLERAGSGMDTRYKLRPNKDGGEFDPATIETTKDIKPVVEYLRSQLLVPPATQTSSKPGTIFRPGGVPKTTTEPDPQPVENAADESAIPSVFSSGSKQLGSSVKKLF